MFIQDLFMFILACHVLLMLFKNVGSNGSSEIDISEAHFFWMVFWKSDVCNDFIDSRKNFKLKKLVFCITPPGIEVLDSQTAGSHGTTESVVRGSELIRNVESQAPPETC